MGRSATRISYAIFDWSPRWPTSTSFIAFRPIAAQETFIAVHVFSFLFRQVSFMVCTFLAICSSFSSAMAPTRERTFIMVKPDGVQRGLIGEIISKFERKGLKLVAMKFMQVLLNLNLTLFML